MSEASGQRVASSQVNSFIYLSVAFQGVAFGQVCVLRCPWLMLVLEFPAPACWRALAWKETDELLNLESYHLLSVHVLQDCCSVNLTVPLPTALIPSLGCLSLRPDVYSPISAHQLADGKPHVCALKAFNKHERVWLAVGEHHIYFGLSIYCWWQPINLISCTIFNGTAN